MAQHGQALVFKPEGGPAFDPKTGMVGRENQLPLSCDLCVWCHLCPRMHTKQIECNDVLKEN